jgi:dihydroneopterin aldolase
MQFQIKDFEIHLSLGVLPLEKVIKNKALVTVRFNYKTETAERSDSLNDTIDYDEIARLIEMVAMAKHYNLIEHFLAKLRSAITDFDSGITDLGISVKKLSALSKAAYVEIRS